MKNVKKLEVLLEYPLKQYDFDAILRLDYMLEKYKVFETLDASTHNIKSHLIGTAKNVAKCFDEYTASLNLINYDYLKTTAVLAGFFHDLGKVLWEGRAIYDSLEIEVLLRKYGFKDIAQAVRHNPYLFLYDLHNGHVTIPQLVVTYADSQVNSAGEYVDRKVRLEKILSNKKINKTFQKEYWSILERVYVNRVIRTPHNITKISFFERCDGRYPVSNSIESLGKLSSYHLAKEMSKMGYSVSIFTDNSNEFNTEGINFYGIGSDLLESYSAAKKFDITFVTGWTSLFSLLKKSNSNLPMMVMRSLKESSLNSKRVEPLLENDSRVILVSKESKLLLLKYADKKNANFRVIPNGIDKKTFFYKSGNVLNQFVYAGATVEEKGIYEVIEIAKAFPNLKCVIAGSANMYGQNEINKDKLPDNIVFLGEVSQSQLAEIYRTSLFSLALTDPEKIFETFGKSAAESQLCGCPVLHLKNGGLNSTVLEYKLNFGLKKFNLIKFAEFINQNLNNFSDSNQREELALKANEVHRSWKTIAGNYLLSANIELILSLKKLLTTKQKIFDYLYS